MPADWQSLVRPTALEVPYYDAANNALRAARERSEDLLLRTTLDEAGLLIIIDHLRPRLEEAIAMVKREAVILDALRGDVLPREVTDAVREKLRTRLKAPNPALPTSSASGQRRGWSS